MRKVVRLSSALTTGAMNPGFAGGPVIVEEDGLGVVKGTQPGAVITPVIGCKAVNQAKLGLQPRGVH